MYFCVDKSGRFSIHYGKWKRSFFENLLYTLKKAISVAFNDEIFQLEYINPSNKSIENETININDFLLGIKKKIILFKNILNTNSGVHEKIKRGTEDALYKFIEEKYFDLLLTKERILGITGEIRLRISKKDRLKLKDTKESIEMLDKALVKIGNSRRRYVIEQDKNFFKNKK